MNINGIDIDFANNNFVQEMLQICITHPECKDCPYLGQPIQIKDALRICEVGVNKKKENTQ